MIRRWLRHRHLLTSLGWALVVVLGADAVTAQSSAPSAAAAAAAAAAGAGASPSLVGTWTLSAADDLRPDGTRVEAYGPNPRGLLTLGADGRYSVQIFRADRVKFASGDKRRGTPDEYKEASLGMSAHFGRYVVDDGKGTITFQIDRASFPNWDGATQTRPFTLMGDELSWRVPATPDGTMPISVWRRAR
jgi:hypothetical protein